MSASADLLEQARGLASKERRKPKQASLRRALSTAYYSLFHFIGEESTRLLFGSGPGERKFRDFARRALAHSKVKEVTAEFVKPTPKAILREFWSTSAGFDPLGITGDLNLITIEEAFRNLQILRHGADYDFSKNFTRQQAMDACAMAEGGMEAWRNLRVSKPEALRLFATAILLWPGLASRG